MACLIYPYFPIEVPDKLREFLKSLGDKRLFHKAVSDFQDKKMVSGREYFIKENKSIVFFIRKVFINEGEPTAELNCNPSHAETVEDLYISGNLKFVLRGKLLVYKGSGKVYDLECTDIEPIFKGSSLKRREEALSKELTGKLMDTILPKSASYAVPGDCQAKTSESASYVNTTVTTLPKKFDWSNVNLDEVNNIFEDLIKNYPGAKNPMVEYMKKITP